tara:strand:- start:1536 stop:2633 length:1098 start_codon:yes stop_codon:yes gene_type:complete
MIKISIYKRLFTVYKIIAKNFGKWISPLIGFMFIVILRLLIAVFMFLDNYVFFRLRKTNISKPIIIVGNPRSGTTFLQRFLVKNHFGIGSQLWQMIYPSIILQRLLKPILPILEYFSPAKHHSTEAHKTSLSSIETDDVGMLFRFFDGFFLYGFFLSWSKNDLFHWVDPNFRDNSSRDYKWLNSVWKRILVSSNSDRIVAKLFSVSANSPKFLEKYTDAKILYMVRDPLNVIPSGLSLVTGVLDKKFGFWNKPKKDRDRFLANLYKGLVELLLRFEHDWKNNKIDKSKVFIVKFDDMMNDFSGLMNNIITFVNHERTDNLNKVIEIVDNEQKNYVSKHKYDLSKFGLTEDKIKKDCKAYYETFIN